MTSKKKTDESHQSHFDVGERDSSFYEHVMDLTGDQPASKEGRMNSLEAAIYLAIVELQRAGFCKEEVNELLEGGRNPDIEIIREKIESFDSSNARIYSSDYCASAQEMEKVPWRPLDPHGVEACFQLLKSSRNALNTIEKIEASGNVIPADILLSIGIELGWIIHNAGFGTEADFNIWMERRLRPMAKKGKTYSLVRKALQSLILEGHNTGKRASQHLRNAERIEALNIDVSRENDRFGHPVRYTFTDIEGGESDSIECEKIGVWISQEKKKLRDKGLIT